MGAVEPIEARMAFQEPPAAANPASGSSFYVAMRILPREQRDAMYEIYSFCRRVDDIADGEGPRAERLQALELWRDGIDELYQRGPATAPPSNLAGLAAVIERFALDRRDFIAVIDGMEMDVLDTIVAPDAATLDLYCDRVASAVGRLSVRIFGMPEDDGLLLAHHLGRALQLTNILRDIDEDAAIGRVYLPREALLASGVDSLTADAVRTSTLDGACAPVVAQARTHFDSSLEIIARNPRRTVLAPAVMADVYGALLDKLVSRGFAQPRVHVRISKLRKAGLVLKHLRHNWLQKPISARKQ